MRILMVLTSHDQLGNTGRKTGFWLEELAAPYYVFKDAGTEITLASPKGGRPPLDPKSNEPEFRTDLTHGSRRTRPQKLSSTRPFASRASGRKTSTPSFIRAATVRCGISPTTSTPSS
jgi:putative intracellular protease/amidase